MDKRAGIFLIVAGAVYALTRSGSSQQLGAPMTDEKWPGVPYALPDGKDEGLSRGLRNNNPGNIEKGDNWRGLAADQSGDNRFAVFDAPVWGIRAMARVLINYQARHGLNTVRGLVGRWAPSHENPTGNYVSYVANAAGVDPDRPIRFIDYLPRIIPAMIQFENGAQPYSQDLINEGIGRAV